MNNLFIAITLSYLISIAIAYKWELNLKIVVFACGIIGIFVGLVINVIEIYYSMNLLLKLMSCCFLILLSSVSALLVWFYRDPKRIPPDREDVILAPADGLIKYIKKIEKGEIPFSSKGKDSVKLASPLTDILNNGEGYLIGIAMTHLDAHIIRAPVKGKITHFKRISGRFLSLKKEDAPYRNERLVEIIDSGSCKIGLIQIASRMVRGIAAYSKKDDELILGQKIGVIRIGSQTDIVLPRMENLKISVTVKEQVYAGLSIIAEI